MMVLLVFNVLNNSFSIFIIDGKNGVSGLPGEIG